MTLVTCFHLHFFLLMVAAITQFPLSCHGCHEQDRKALLDFKSSLEDPGNRLSSWQDTYQHRNCCNWQGIGCSYDSCRVISINLRNEDFETYLKELVSGNFGLEEPDTLYGNFSASLVNVTLLEYLDVSFNSFQGSKIPFQLSKLTKLVHLDLSFTELSASTSTQFNNLSSLQFLDLTCNAYGYHFLCIKVSSTKWIRGLKNLKVLKLTGIDLNEAASSEKNFAESISYLSNLRDLDLSFCNLSSTVFPIHEFHNLSRLSSLILSDNSRLRFQIPVQMASLTSLSTLDLSSCGLKGSVPYLPQLTELDVSDNYNLRPDLTRMFQHQWPMLETLSMSYTHVSGSIPVSISNAPSLVSLSANSSSVQGSLPSSIYNLSRLQSLDLHDNNITGYIHSSISNLKFLNILHLSKNNIQGPIPKSISNLKYLNSLDLSTNNIQGSIPESICKLTSLQRLDLSNNNITGVIPSCLPELKNLSALSVSKNTIEGNISLLSLINDINLFSLDLSSNRLTVGIDQVFHVYFKSKLENLNLRSCNIKGAFPTFICELSNLKDLDLSDNHLFFFFLK